jgi:hypothetical protein
VLRGPLNDELGDELGHARMTSWLHAPLRRHGISESFGFIASNGSASTR